MQIKRDYSKPLFRDHRRKRGTWRWILLYLLGIGAFLFFVDSQFAELQLMALDMVGQAPPPTPFASELATQGMNLYMSGDMQGARSYFQRAVRQQPQNVDYLYEYGRVLLELGVDEPSYFLEAISIGDQAINARSNDPRGYVIKARAVDLNGDPANAVPIAQAGLQHDRNFAPLHTALSSAYRQIDRYDVALEAAERAIELDPLDPLARRVYALALIWVGRYSEALDQLEQAVALNPNLASPYFELASMYRTLAVRDPNGGADYYALAIATYEQVLALQPQNAKAYLRLCETFTAVGEHRRGQGYCEDALTINPNYAQAWRALGQTEYPQRNYEGAIEAFQRCVELGSEEIECYYLRGLSHYYLGECPQAWDILSDSLTRARAISTTSDDQNPVIINIRSGLVLVTDNCEGYAGRALPQPPTPTAIPPTPIGG
jgi:tetratricopeptide (TPR) repeat protein